ncbi:MAG: DUF4139 domain-containing protein [Bacteroidetes bacterium]|nr:DUF4139 domain-containing protein [Bacteroidota bacterium]
MKNLILFLLLSGFSLYVCAGSADSIKLVTKVKGVTLFMNGAGINREVKQLLTAGRQTLVFRKLSYNLDPKNIRFSVDPELSVLAISDRKNPYACDKSAHETIRRKEDSVKNFNAKISLLQNELNAYETELTLLKKNDDLGGKEKGVPVEELSKAADFYRARTKEIFDKCFRLRQEMEEIQKIITEVEKRINRFRLENMKPSSEIILEVLCPKQAEYTFNLNYFVYGAGWRASYDIKATEISQDIEFDYNALVYNNTGVDWNDVKVILSTADPTQSASKPELSAWTLNYYNGYGNEGYVQTASTGEYYRYELEQSSAGMLDEEISTGYGADRRYGVDVITVSELSAEFEISTPYTIPSNGKPYLIEVNKNKLPATYKHLAVPKVDRDAFLLARISGWEDLDITDGHANIYFGNTYIGQSYINTRYVEDTLDLSLGRDKKILVTRTKKKDFSSKKIIGTNKKEIFTYEIIVKNNRKGQVEMELIDQVPVSQESDITVEILDISGAARDELSGKLTWDIKLQAGESKKFTISYSVKYPKNRSVQTRKTRAISAPAFM